MLDEGVVKLLEELIRSDLKGMSGAVQKRP